MRWVNPGVGSVHSFYTDRQVRSGPISANIFSFLLGRVILTITAGRILPKYFMNDRSGRAKFFVGRVGSGQVRQNRLMRNSAIRFR